MSERYEEIEFKGNLIWSDLSENKVSVYVKLNQLKYGEIKGHFYCEEKLPDNKYCSYFSIISKFKNKCSNYFKFNKCLINQYAGGEVKKYYFKCQEFEDICDEPIPEVKDVKSIKIRFNINYHPLFDSYLLREPLRNIKTLEEYQKTLVTLYEKDNRKIEYGFELLSLDYAIDDINGVFETFNQVLILTIDNPLKSIEDSINVGKKIIENLLLLFSFWSRKRIEYFKYECLIEHQDDKKIWSKEVLNGNKKIAYKGGGREKFSQRFEDFQVFIEKSFPVLLEKIEIYNLQESIWNYVISFEVDYMESKFLYLCNCMEALKDGHLNINEKRFCLSKGQFKKFMKKVRYCIGDCATEKDINTDIVSYITEKISDLRRPTFRAILTDLIEGLEIKIDDLENEKIYDFIKYRDDLIHKGKIKNDDGEQLWIERDRLRLLVARIILRILEFPVSLHAYPDRPINITDKKMFSKDRYVK